MLNSLRYLFFPETCRACDHELLASEHLLCTECRHDLPLTDFHTYNDDRIKKVFYGRLKLENATALLYFEKRGPVQELMHNLKYRGERKISTLLGNWLGHDLSLLESYQNIDHVISVPIHPKKLKTRGYNQVDGFTEAIASHLGASCTKGILTKSKNTKTQVFKGRFTRSDEVFRCLSCTTG